MVKSLTFFQSLEMQLKLNNSIFSRQLASESKKLLEATMITKDLLVEINIVHQKIKVFQFLSMLLALQENSSTSCYLFLLFELEFGFLLESIIY